MNWQQDWDRDTFIPRRVARFIWRFFLMVLIIAGLFGAAFEAIQCSRVVSHIINDSPSHPTNILHSHKGPSR